MAYRRGIRGWIQGAVLFAALLVGGGYWFQLGGEGTGEVQAAEEGKPAVDEKALNRTRKQVRMLDDLYKTAVVLITDKYVKDVDSLPAGTAALALFGAMKEKGWHEVRLLDATGEPYEPENVAKDSFEKKGISQLKEGKGYYEEVISKDGKPYLRAMTAIPVVLQKCVSCHANYRDVKPGEAIGALSYTIEIE